MCFFHFYSNFNRTFCKQTVQILIRRNVSQCPLHHVTYVSAKFEVDLFTGLGGDAFTKNALFAL